MTLRFLVEAAAARGAGGHPVQHLADALANAVQDTAAARTSVVRHVDHDLFARQMIGQRLAPWPLVGDLDVYVRTARFGAPDITIEIFQAEGELIRIKALGTAAELRPVKLFDDRLKSLDLAVTMLDDGRHVAQKTVQQGHVGRQIVEIEPHA